MDFLFSNYEIGYINKASMVTENKHPNSSLIPSNVLGIDIGGTRIKSVLLGDGNISLQTFEDDSNANQGIEAVLTAIQKTYNFYIEKNFLIKGIGIGCAGSVVPLLGIVRNSPNFLNWKDVPLKELVEKKCGVAVTVENDANCAAYSEFKLGAGRGYQNLVLLTFGTGVGGGIIINGKLYRGSSGTAGEIGHLTIHTNGEPCSCGNTGCFERYCSASAIRKKSGGASARDVFEKASTNSTYKKIIKEFMDDLKITLVSLANVFDPDCFLIGGAVANGMNPYIPELKNWLMTHAFPAVGANVEIKKTENLNWSGALGAALLFNESSESIPAKLGKV